MPSMPHVPIAEASSVTVQGRLKEHSDFWLTELEASNFVRGIVQHGYRSPFYQVIPDGCQHEVVGRPQVTA